MHTKVRLFSTYHISGPCPPDLKSHIHLPAVALPASELVVSIGDLPAIRFRSPERRTNGVYERPLRWLPVREVTKLFPVILTAHNQRSIEPDAVIENDKYGRRDSTQALVVWGQGGHVWTWGREKVSSKSVWLYVKIETDYMCEKRNWLYVKKETDYMWKKKLTI